MGCFWVPRLVCNSLVFTQTKFASGIVNQELNWYYILCVDLVQELEEVGGLEELEKEIGRRIKAYKGS